MEFFKKYKIYIGVVVIALAALLGFWYFALRGSGDETAGPVGEAQTVRQIQPDEIGLELELTADKRNVIMTITKLEGIKSVEYELSYDAEETVEGETSNVPKGAISSEPIEVAGESEIKREIFLGTCSAVCRPDRVTSDIKVLVRVNFEDGEIGAAETTVPFETTDEE